MTMQPLAHTFLHDLMKQMSGYVTVFGAPHYDTFSRILEDERCKRMLFDARQAVIFDGYNTAPPPNIQESIRLPFNTFYMEFSEPVMLANREPGIGERDFARALLVMADEAMIAPAYARLPNSPAPEQMTPVQAAEEAAKNAILKLTPVTFFLHNPDHDMYVDRSFKVHLPTGTAWVKVKAATQTPYEAHDPNEIDQTDLSTGLDHMHPESYVLAGWNAEERHVGWWERACQEYTTLLMWILAYMMAKSIIIEEETLSRQVRRWHERKNIKPKPWHIVKVDPKFYRHGRADDRGPEQPGRQHSYRYDVIGHLRFGNHKTKDGYKPTVEWVMPHQRGLANELYIPKTYVTEKGRRLHPRMKEWYKK